MCRKWTSSLIAQFLVIRPEQFQPSLCTYEAYREYVSSPGRFRGFCGNCGSSLIWRSDADTSTLDLFLGTLDEQWLTPTNGNGSEYLKDVAKVLTTPSGTQFWMENAVPGITDLLKTKGGRVYLQEGPDGLRLI